MDEIPSDVVWARRLVSGDEAALGEIYDAYGGLVYGLALRLTRSRELAEDVVQEVFSFLWERPAAFDPGKGTLRSWLGLLAHRRSVETVRREELRRRPAASDDMPLPGVDEAVTEELYREQIRGRVAEAVARLPEPLRQVVELAYYKGRTYRQVAAELGSPEGTVKSRIRAALKQIAEDLAEEGVTP
ncbi:sigma-70 family RNA polymerase sigma factor [Actinocorallia longicatena]|uniref:Sigma-70 family RNA polymerase sigma factor n=1 Tax=Actinocorallia longicatena TaxID=111803 RepID=A0ABP6QMV5_9ACTN